jgi:hypothetical protein
MTAFAEKEFEEISKEEASETTYFGGRLKGGREEAEKRQKKLGKDVYLNEESEKGRGDVEELPMPGVPDFWASTDVELEEELEPPTRNKPTSAPWEE